MTQSKNDEPGIRTGFLVVMTCILALLGVGIWFLKATPAQRTQTAPPPAEADNALPPQTAQSQSAPQRNLHRDYPPVQAQRPPMAARQAATLEDQWGIQIDSMRLTMANSVVDLRYKILDPEKAALLANGKTPAYILDHASGRMLVMPTPPKEGAFPPTAHRLIAQKTYFTMVSNPGGTLKSGSEVTVVVGGSQVTNLTVQ